MSNLTDDLAGKKERKKKEREELHLQQSLEF